MNKKELGDFIIDTLEKYSPREMGQGTKETITLSLLEAIHNYIDNPQRVYKVDIDDMLTLGMSFNQVFNLAHSISKKFNTIATFNFNLVEMDIDEKDDYDTIKKQFLERVLTLHG